MNDDEDVYVDPLSNMAQSAICLIKLLLGVALRFGHVNGTTLAQVLEHTANRADRTIQWTRPDWPVICAMPNGASLPSKTPALYQQLDKSVKQMALAAGILGRATSHALKRGVARDVAYSQKQIAGVGTAAVQMALHHSNATRRSGTTQDYAGSSQVPIYNMRAEARFVDRMAPKIAASPYQPSRATTAEIDAYMEKKGMDKSIITERNKASKHLQMDKIAEWEASEKDRVAGPAHNAPSDVQLSKLTGEIGRGKTLVFPHAVERMRDANGPRALSERSKSAVNTAQGRLAPKESGKVLSNDNMANISIDHRPLEAPKAKVLLNGDIADIPIDP